MGSLHLAASMREDIQGFVIQRPGCLSLLPVGLGLLLQCDQEVLEFRVKWLGEASKGLRISIVRVEVQGVYPCIQNSLHVSIPSF